MSDVLSDYKRRSYEWKISCKDPPSTHTKKNAVDESEIAVALKIPYPLLKIWHEKVTEECDYVDFLNATIVGSWFKVRKETGNRIKGRIEREAGAVATKYKQIHGRKRKQLDYKYLTLSVFHSELVSVNQLEEELDYSRNEVLEWKKKYEDLESEKQKLLREMSEALQRKDDEINEHEASRIELTKYVEMLEKGSGLTCQSKKIGDVGVKQKSRKLKVLKERGECALWFAKSFGLDLTCIKFKDHDSTANYTFNYGPSSSTPNAEAEANIPPTLNERDNTQIEKILFLLDKFFVSDEFYHELTIAYDDVPRSYLIKQLRSNLNKICHIESVPGVYPGAQCSFKELLTQHIRDLLSILKENSG